MRLVASLIVALVLPVLGAGHKPPLPHSPSAQDWTSYGGDPRVSKYSPLTQINRENVTRLSVAWVYHTGDISDGSKYPSRSAFEATPLVADGVVYVTTPFNRLIALDGETAREIWRFDPKIDKDRAENLFISRGVAYWVDGGKKRLFLGTLDGRLFSIDATTGKPDESFGLAGWVDLRPGVAEKFSDRVYGMTSPPAIYKNLVICGSLTADGEPLGPAGDVRAFSALTGKLVWTFHTVAQAGEAGNDTWADKSWKERAAANEPPHSVRMVKIIDPGVAAASPQVTAEVPSGAKLCQPVKVSAKTSRALPVLRFVWDFGDGTQEEGSSLTHTYTPPKNYSVRLVAEGFEGQTGKTFPISVTGELKTNEPQMLVQNQHPAFHPQAFAEPRK